METYHKIQTLFKRDMDGSRTGQKGKMIRGEWTTPELDYLSKNNWEFTEKVDGTNIRIYYRPAVAGPDGFRPLVEFAGRSDNAVIPEPLLSYLKDTFTPELFEKADLHHSPVLLFGEGYGPKIQGGGKYRDDHAFVLFDVKIGDWWLLRESVTDIAYKLRIMAVPVIGYGTLYDAIDLVSGVKRAVVSGRFGDPMPVSIKVPTLRSEWGDFEAEGIVARPVVPMFSRKGDRIITKIKAVDFR